MPRPKTKDDLLSQSKTNFDKLFEFVEALPKGEQVKEFPPGSMNRNIRDLLAHLHHWHLMMLEWYKVGMQGDKPSMPAEGYYWKDLPALNKWIWKKYNSMPLTEAKKQVKESYQHVQKLITSHTDEELFEKKRYNWTGTTSLSAYLISATSSHYDTVFKLLKKWRKAINS
jgi:hypothetical protein